MYQFLCLFGPGVPAWLSGGLYAGLKKETEKGILVAVAKGIAYAFMNVTVVTAVCKPLGRIEFIMLPDGTRTVFYGASALIVAAATAMVLGVAGAALERWCSNFKTDRKKD